ncbi:MAG: PilZ domain-containing protein [Chloroflexi bacterium]|nr:PilZ domain-containing protein [Chloroflexota bacterium]
METQTTTVRGERRSKPRVDCAYSAIVRGRARNQEKFQEPGRVLNLSVSGLYVHLKRSVEIGRELLIAMWFEPTRQVAQTPTIVMRGLVVRAELLADGSYGVGLKLEHHRFL